MLESIIKIFLFTCILFCFTKTTSAQEEIIGRWDITITKDGKQLPSWLEITKSGHETLVGRFVYAFGSARPISNISIVEKGYHFSIPRQWEPKGGDMQFIFDVNDDQLKGTMIYTDGKKSNWTAVRQPKIEYVQNPKWGEEIILFDGSNLAHWNHTEDSQWDIIGDVLSNPKSGSNLITIKKFQDFKLHIEFKYPKDGNSGVYLRGRHEIQVQDDHGKEPASVNFGGVYGFLTPNEMAALPAGKWQTYDITLIGNRVTVIANGKTIIADQTIPGITGGALDSMEGNPGPIMIQGDHGPVEYRNIILTPRIN